MDTIEAVINFLRANKLVLTTAESCTAGLQASILADHPGCGSVFESGYVVYAPRAKRTCLAVSAQTIKTFGLTSEEVAREMAIGALKISGANLVVANTGKADSNDELKGVVCFAYAVRFGERISVISETVRFSGSRNEVRTAAARHGLLRLPLCYEHLLSTTPEVGARAH